jgi:hypothetical protein
MTTTLSISEPILAALEAELTEVPRPYALVYDSDDEETRAVLTCLPRPWWPHDHVMEMRLCCTADHSGAATVDTAGTPHRRFRRCNCRRHCWYPRVDPRVVASRSVPERGGWRVSAYPRVLRVFSQSMCSI